MTDPATPAPGPPAAGLAVDARCEVGSFSLVAQAHAAPGEVVAVIGPNGSGKSTLLRCVAGLRRLSGGSLRLAGRVLDEPTTSTFVDPRDRRVGMVFSDHRLFPSMSALENAAFGLRSRGVAAGPARTAAGGWLDRLGLAGLGDRRPHQLSGGQAQRVAIARALASDPAVLLLDEPLAALDVATRAEVRTALAEHVAAFAGPALLVTHDPLEAVLLASTLVVLEGGRVVQRGSATEVTGRPATPYVARVVGVNLWRGVGHPDGTVALDTGGSLQVATPVTGAALVSAPPSAFLLSLGEPKGVSARNVWRAAIGSLDVVGDAASGAVRARLAGPPDVAVDVTAAAVAELGLAPGRAVWVAAKATALTAYPAPALPT